MTLGDFISLLLCLILAAGLGIVSQRILGFKTGGLLVSILIGFVGALLGREMVRFFHLPEWIQLTVAGTTFPVTWCVVGAVVFNLIVGFIARQRGKKDKRK